MKEPFDPKKRRSKQKRRKYVFTAARKRALAKAQRALHRGKSHSRHRTTLGKKKKHSHHRSYDPEKSPSGRMGMSFVEPIVADIGGFVHELASNNGISYPVQVGGKQRDLVGVGVQVVGALIDSQMKGRSRATGDLINNFTTGYGVAALEDPPYGISGGRGGGSALIIG